MEYALALLNAFLSYSPFMVGIILPPFIEILNKDIKRESERYLVAILVCVVCAIMIHWEQLVSGNPAQAALVAGLIFAESQTIFKLYFAKSKMRGTIQEKIGVSEDRKEINPEVTEKLSTQ